ncbi:MAG: hypothetical protein D6769_00170 [Methanobacteriota archaeon]|nr:MAG: hypothetical protein D6769_00170 [Euryarchaeota archaeon]
MKVRAAVASGLKQNKFYAKAKNFQPFLDYAKDRLDSPEKFTLLYSSLRYFKEKGEEIGKNANAEVALLLSAIHLKMIKDEEVVNFLTYLSTKKSQFSSFLKDKIEEGMSLDEAVKIALSYDRHIKAEDMQTFYSALDEFTSGKPEEGAEKEESPVFYGDVA